MPSPPRKLTSKEASDIKRTQGRPLPSTVHGVQLQRSEGGLPHDPNYMDRSAPHSTQHGTASAAYHTSFTRGRAHSESREHAQAAVQYHLEAQSRPSHDAGHVKAKDSAKADRDRHQQHHFREQRENFFTDVKGEKKAEFAAAVKSFQHEFQRGARSALTRSSHRSDRESMDTAETSHRTVVFEAEVNARHDLLASAVAERQSIQTRDHARRVITNAAFPTLLPETRRSQRAEAVANASRSGHQDKRSRTVKNSPIHQPPPRKGRR